MRNLSVCAVLLLLPALVHAAPIVNPIETVNGAWSKELHGVRARLIATSLAAYKDKPQLGLAVEIENASDSATPISIWWGYLGDMLTLTLEDEAGKPCAMAGIGGNHIDGPPFRLPLPVGTTLRATISSGALEYVPSGRVLLRPFSLVAWELAPTRSSKLYLRAKLAPGAPTDGKRASWSGPLELPRIALPLPAK